MSEDYKIETYIQTLQSGKKRIVIALCEIKKKLVNQYYIDINPEDFK